MAYVGVSIVPFQPYRAAFAAELTFVIAVFAFAAQPGAAEDPDELFQRIKTHMTQHLGKLPNYTCHETIDRVLRSGGMTRHLDRVELEVAFVGQQELFSRPGENRFGEQSISQLVSGGTISNSALGAHVDIIFSRDIADFKYAGECKKDGHKTIRYDLRVPIEKSDFHVRHNGAEGPAGYQGSIWVDAETLDLIRVDYKVNRIPAHLGVSLIEKSLRYKKLMIGNSEINLPEHSTLGAIDDRGAYTLNMIKLTDCREFAADSVVKYGPPSQGSATRERQEH
jgi:hypothetical protein